MAFNFLSCNIPYKNFNSTPPNYQNFNKLGRLPHFYKKIVALILKIMYYILGKFHFHRHRYIKYLHH